MMLRKEQIVNEDLGLSIFIHTGNLVGNMTEISLLPQCYPERVK
jgi:hypothetical protein